MKSLFSCCAMLIVTASSAFAQVPDFAADVRSHVQGFDQHDATVIGFSKQLQCVMKLDDADLLNAFRHGLEWQLDRYLIHIDLFLPHNGTEEILLIHCTPIFPGPWMNTCIGYHGLIMLPECEQLRLLRLICPTHGEVTTETTEVTIDANSATTTTTVDANAAPVVSGTPVEGADPPAPPSPPSDSNFSSQDALDSVFTTTSFQQ